MRPLTATHAVVDRYFDMWNTSDARERRRLVEQVWLADAQSIDPLAAVSGWDELHGFVSSVRQQYPSHRIERSGPVDQHHDRLRFAWTMYDGAGSAVLTGIDCVRVATDGRFVELVGFFDGPAPAP